jgi:hypothetical protein
VVLSGVDRVILGKVSPGRDQRSAQKRSGYYTCTNSAEGAGWSHEDETDGLQVDIGRQNLT